MIHYFAKIEDSIVVDVVCIDIDGVDFPESEEIGKEKLISLHLKGEYVETCPNGSFRGNFSRVGCAYDGSIFFTNKPFESWILDDSGKWKSPKPKPIDDKIYYWDESSLEWIEKSN